MGRSREWFNLPKKYNSTGVSTAGKIDSKLNHQKWGDTLLQTDSAIRIKFSAEKKKSRTFSIPVFNFH